MLSTTSAASLLLCLLLAAILALGGLAFAAPSWADEAERAPEGATQINEEAEPSEPLTATEPSEPLTLSEPLAAAEVLDVTAKDAGDLKETAAEENTTAIMGYSSLSAAQMASWYNSKDKTYPSQLAAGGASNITEFSTIVLEESRAEGVLPEVVFTQMMLESGWLQFGGAVKVEQYNFCGLGAIDSDPVNSSAWFPDVRTGIRAQVQHLKAYATSEGTPLVNACVDPRFDLVKRGCAPYVEWLGQKENPLGYGWATSLGYGQRLVGLMGELRNTSDPGAPGDTGAPGDAGSTGDGDSLALTESTYPFISPLAGYYLPASTSNYTTSGREGRTIDKIVLHHAAALTVTSVGYHFQNPSVEASAHYGVGPGQIYCYVPEDKAAWHCGNYEQNLRSVGIETVNSALAPDYPVAKASIDTLIPLVADVAQRNGLGKLVKYQNIFQHRDFASTFCAGHVWDYIDYIITEANLINGYGDDWTVTQHEGSGRQDTAARASAKAYPDPSQVDNVILAYSYDFPDALAASYLAGVLDAPILLCDTNELPAPTVSELSRLNPSAIYIVGGTGVISGDIETMLQTSGSVSSVIRLGGTGREETAYLIAEAAKTLGGVPTTAFVAHSGNFPDALSAGSLSASQHVPILLTSAETLDGWAQRFLEECGVKDIIVVGGAGSVSENVENQLRALPHGPSVVRWSGPGRYETAEAVLNGAIAKWSVTPSVIGLASGEDFPDALVGGASVGNRGGLLAITEPDVLSNAAAETISAYKDSVLDVEIFGGTGTIRVRSAAQWLLM
jgi:putative cell wall-binding protein